MGIKNNEVAMKKKIDNKLKFDEHMRRAFERFS